LVVSEFGHTVLRRRAVPELSDERAFRESILEGGSVRIVAKRHGIPESRAFRAIKAGAEAFVSQVHLDLLASHGNGELPAILLPNQPGPTLDRALDFARWLSNELEQRGIAVRLHYRTSADGGLIIALSDRDRPPNSKVNVERLDEKKEQQP
jgi:hypothetical protein